ncbi:hypothetical protein CR51_36305 [Caballeronia megalochromosomata]|nr:hypothetical protein CR51_36305 [Caballeronia megalochromosomata]
MRSSSVKCAVRAAAWVIACAAAGCGHAPGSAESAASADMRDTAANHLPDGAFLEPEDRAALPPGVSIRPVYAKGISLTKVSEGFVPNLYEDVARYCTIGYGHLVKRAPCNGTEPAEFLGGLSEPRGGELLVADMLTTQRAVMTLLQIDVTDGQYAALCDFTFNVGPSNLRKSKLLRLVNARQFDQVPGELILWTKAGGKENDGLKRRREREIALFFDGRPVPKAAAPEGLNRPLIDIRTGEPG